jgi:hypothetical protein
MYEVICSFLKQSGDLLNILGMVGIALLTILIPVAVAIFNDKKDFEVLDRNVILDHVIKARYFLIYLALVYIPILLWVSSSYPVRIIELVAWGIGVYFITMVLINAYHWMKGNKFMLRFDYLRKLNNPKDMEEAWRSVWEAKNINTQNEREFFTIFSFAIDNLLEDNGRQD